ncbi:MAG: BamA/TamA family outer membrane protein [Salinibacter sp.]
MRYLSSSVLALVLLLVAVPDAAAQSAPSTATAQPSARTAPEAEPVDDDPDPWEWTESYVDDHLNDYVGAGAGWTRPHERTSVLYPTAPPFRYNRVEGLVLGVRRDPLSLRDPDETARIYGQVSYAFALKDLRYNIGVESKIIHDPETGLKLGVSYRRQTRTPDHWKTSFLENSLSSLGLGYDFFDYYEAQGLSFYAVQALPGSVRLKAGVRTEKHRSLSRNNQWSLFDVGTVRPNPAVEQKRLQAGVLSLEGGRIRNHDDLPSGAAIRVAATLGTAFGGDINANRYEMDGRVFVPLAPDTHLGLRLRGGYATSGAPPQMQFTIGSIGSLRSYPQNAFRGTRMLLGNAEYIIDEATLDTELLEDAFLVGLFDAGWVGQPGQPVRLNDVYPSAGFGIGLDERAVRLEVSWPLRNGSVTSSSPSIWLRITPNF